MSKRFYFMNGNDENIANDHIGNIRGARTVAKRLANELGDLFAESHRLENGIREKLAGIGFKVKETEV